MTFLEAYTIHGPDVERIAEDLGITPPEADRLVNEEIERKFAHRLVTTRREYNARVRDQLRGIRCRRPA